MSDINIIVEPNYMFNNRFVKITNGITKIGKKNQQKLVPMNIEDINEAPRYNFPFIVLGASMPWTISTTDFLLRKNYHPIIAGFSFDAPICTFITQNHFMDAYTLSYWFLTQNSSSPACLGFNFSSFCDNLKYSGFLKAASNTGSNYSDDDLYVLKDDFDECIDNFISNVEKYNSVFCANDSVTMYLLSKLKNHKQIDIISFGDLYIKRYSSVPFYSISPDYLTIGKLAAHLYSTLFNEEFSTMSNSTIYVKSRFNAPVANEGVTIDLCEPGNLESIDNNAYNPAPPLYEIDLLNSALEHCDNTDLKILSYLQNGLTYEKIAESLYMSTNSVKRRFHKILESSGVKNKNEWLLLTKKYLLNFQ